MRRAAAIGTMAMLGVALALAGCAQVKPASKAQYKPAALSAVEGSPVKQVTLTEEAAHRIDLATVPVRADGALLVVPSAAVIYDPKGNALVYTATSQLAFRRAGVSVAKSNAQDTWLSSGPSAGTQVVTTGAAEVYGAEFEVGH